MDIFIERIVKKKKDLLDNLIVYGSIPLALVLAVLIFSMTNLYGGSIAVVITALIGYGAYWLISSRDIEYEYAITNGEIDIDRIIAKKKRKKMFNGNCRDFEVVAKKNSEKYDRSIIDIPQKIYASSDINSENTYFFVSNHKGRRVVVYFEPDSKILGIMKSMNPRRVF